MKQSTISKGVIYRAMRKASPGRPIEEAAVKYLQTTTETYLINMLLAATSIADRSKRRTISIHDIKTVENIRKLS
jgi:histone H3/H4